MEMTTYVTAVILAFARIASFIFFIPFLKGRYIPPIAKITISLAISMAAANQMTEVEISSLVELVGLIIMQAMIGLTLAFIIEMMFSAARNAGSLLDMDMGFSASSMIDPGSGQRNTVMSNFFFLLFMIVFVSLGGINQLIYGIVYSFQFTPQTMFLTDTSFIHLILAIFAYMMTATIQISLPLTASMFIVNLMLMILGKSAPQMNIFLNMFAIKIAVGLLFLFLTIPFLAEIFSQMNAVMIEKYFDAMTVLLQK